VKRIGMGLRSLTLASLALAIGCETNIPVDSEGENPAVLGPKGIIRGSITYNGPSPCFRNGEVEGQVVVLLFDAANPPPPDGLATTALNFATVPGAKLFANVPPPSGKGPDGKPVPGSVGSSASFCPSVSSPPITAGTEWSMQQVGAGRFQVRSFYSRQSRWNPLFNFANLALAGDIAGGAFVDAREKLPRYATIEVGKPITAPASCAPRDTACEARKADAAAGKLFIPESGFLREGVPITLGTPLRLNRPYFHVDLTRSTGFGQPPLIAKDFADQYAAQRAPLDGAATAARGYITFPQDHLSTSQSNGLCAGQQSQECDLFSFAQASFPQIRFKYGFAGAADNIADPAGADGWIGRNAVPAQAFSNIKRKYYGIDPKEFEGDIPTSGKFALTRVFDKNGQPEIIRDNDTLEQLAKIAEIFPSVVLSKLVDDGEGKLALPPRSQTDPIVVIQTMTIKDWEGGPRAGQGSMKATSEGPVIFGGLTNQTAIVGGKCDTNADCKIGVCNASKICEAAPGSVADPNHPLQSREGVVLQDGFTALIRPSVVCIYPQDDLRGTLVTPVQKDPNPANAGVDLVLPEKIKQLRANRVKQVAFGCLPPGYYSINVVYPTGQAWSFPNLSGHCSYTARSSLPGEIPQQNEDCYMPNRNVSAGGFNWLDGKTVIRAFDPLKGFPLRPLLRSQSPFQYEDDGRIKMGPFPGGPEGDTRTVQLPQVVVITPSPRCGSWRTEEAEENVCTDPNACPSPYLGTPNGTIKSACIPGERGGSKRYCDLNGDGKITRGRPIWANNPMNEDNSLDTPSSISPKSGNGLLDPGEDQSLNGQPPNGKLDMHVPFTCSLPRDRWSTLPTEKLLK